MNGSLPCPCPLRLPNQDCTEGFDRSNFTSGEEPLDSMEFFRMCHEGTGQIMEMPQYMKRSNSRSLIRKESDWVANQLSAHGRPGYKTGRGIFRVGVGSVLAEEVPSYVDSNIIPWVASRNRRQMLLNLEYFLSSLPNYRFELWTFTAGIRTPLAEVRSIIRQLSRDLSRLNSESFMREFGAEFQFRSTEFGSVNCDDGSPSFHIHAHVFVKLNRFLDEEERTNLRDRISDKWPAYWSDCGGAEIRDPKQACQYLVKIQDLRKLRGPEFVELSDQVKGLRLVETMGEFRLMASELKRENLKIIRSRGRLRRMKKRNRRKSRQVDRSLREEPVENLIIAITPPSHAFYRVAEPCLIITNYNPETIQDHKDFRMLSNLCKDRYECGMRTLMEGSPP